MLRWMWGAMLWGLLMAYHQESAAAEPAAGEKAAGEKSAKPPAVSRADLGNSYLRMERAYFTHLPSEIERVAEINEAFDTATLSFFSGNLADTLRKIDTLTAGLLYPEQATAAMAAMAAMSLGVDCDPAVAIVGDTTSVELRLRSLYKVDNEDPVVLTLSILDAKQRSIWQTELPAMGKNEIATLANIALHIAAPSVADAGPDAKTIRALDLGNHVLELFSGSVHLPAGRWPVVQQSLDVVREQNAARLAKIDPSGAALQAALSACQDRNALLTDRPSREQSAQFLTDPNLLVQELSREIADLEAGHDPYARRLGDYWRTIQAGEKKIPLRVYAPKIAREAQPVALLVALHGAGGDENLFFEGYGLGRIKELADQHGMLVATPSTYVFGGKSEYFDALLAALSHDYAIDPQRIYIMGHSMGAGAAARLASAKADKLAAVCCLSGGGSFQAKPMAPTFVVTAELDKIIPAAGLERGVRKAIEAGQPIELRTIEHYGHTLMVGYSLPEAMAWLAGHRR